MASKSMKPSAPVARQPKPLTPEEKAEQVARFLSQKREAFAHSFFAGLAHNPGINDLSGKEIASLAVEAADALMEILYPVPDDKSDEIL